MCKVLIVEDDIGIQKQLKWALADFDLVFAKDRESAIAEFKRHEPGVVTLDLGLPPDPTNASEGITILCEILSMNPRCRVIVVTGNEDKAIAARAVRAGAHDYYEKPIDSDELSLIIRRAKHVSELQQSDNPTYVGEDFFGLVGASRSIEVLKKQIAKVALAPLSTLIAGESGTGKEVVAKAIHASSERADGPFVAINCASIPPELLESELFGYEKGAFTGAVKTTKGKIECAHNGTLFLDEIGDMPYNLQAKILRFLQERVIERVGGRSEIPVDVKVLSATHQNLQQMMEQKTFREDLFFRLCEVSLSVPPLRDRGNDIILIAKHFLDKLAFDSGDRPKSLSQDAIEALLAHSWPGNIRELQNKIRSAAILSDSDVINDTDLGLLGSENAQPLFNLRTVRDDAEREVIIQALQFCNGNISDAAKHLGITRPTLYALMDKLQIRTEKPA
uniref:PEP-CTERM-box response regulator transcription factor n=1 Tax=Thaumasiovibrio occultus TaxID=1891184 RepID=UPI000B361AFA|nr:PEP-CTERM-box response regulator transcription factor [Thaumasiovibrio occultus]